MANTNDPDLKDKPLLGGIFEAKRNPSEPTRFGKVYLPDPEWLAQSEPEGILDP